MDLLSEKPFLLMSIIQNVRAGVSSNGLEECSVVPLDNLFTNAWHRAVALRSREREENLPKTFVKCVESELTLRPTNTFVVLNSNISDSNFSMSGLGKDGHNESDLESQSGPCHQILSSSIFLSGNIPRLAKSAGFSREGTCFHENEMEFKLVRISAIRLRTKVLKL